METLQEKLKITSESLDTWAKAEMTLLALQSKELTRQQIEKRKKLAIIAIKSSRFLEDQVNKIELPF